MGKKETLTTLALPNDGKGNAFPGAGAGPLKLTLCFLPFTAGEESRGEGSMIKLFAPLKGKLLTTFCASLALLHTLLSLTHWIFRSLILPYKSSSHSAKCVRCASLRSGGRRLAVRTAMEHPIGALPRTPFPASREFPSRGNEKIGGTGYCVTYGTDSQSRNVLASPLGEEGHEVAKGCMRVRMIMILDVDVTAEGGIIKLIAR